MTPFRKTVLSYICSEILSCKELANGEAKARRLNVIAGYAWALHEDLRSDGQSLQFSAMMFGNRGCEPENPEFFQNIAAIEDFVGLVNGLN